MKRLCFQLFAFLRISEFIFTSNQAPVLLFQEVPLMKHTLVFISKIQKQTNTKGVLNYRFQTHSLFKCMHEFLSIPAANTRPFFSVISTPSLLLNINFHPYYNKSVKFIGLDTTTFKSHTIRICKAIHICTSLTSSFRGGQLVKSQIDI